MAQANLTPQQRAQIASRFEVWGSIIEVKRWFRSTFGIHKKVSPNTIKTCHSKLLNIGTVLRKSYKTRPLTARTQDNIDVVKQTYVMRTMAYQLGKFPKQAGYPTDLFIES